MVRIIKLETAAGVVETTPETTLVNKAKRSVT